MELEAASEYDLIKVSNGEVTPMSGAPSKRSANKPSSKSQSHRYSVSSVQNANIGSKLKKLPSNLRTTSSRGSNEMN